jgi:hypothetical protein
MKRPGGTEERRKRKFQANLLHSAMTPNRNKTEVLKGRNSNDWINVQMISVFKLVPLILVEKFSEYWKVCVNRLCGFLGSTSTSPHAYLLHFVGE